MSESYITPISSPPLTSSEIRQRVFDGDILSFSPPSMQVLLSHVKGVICETFECDSPPDAYQQYNHEEFLQRAETAQKIVNSEECKKLFGATLSDLGMPPQDLFWDTLGLRISPPVRNQDDIKKRGFRSHVGVHRDTWGAGFQSQVNWWCPLYPLAAKRTMGFYPSYWHRPLSNSTADWSFKEFLKSRKEAKPGHAAQYPSAPAALAEPDEPAVPFMMKVGSLACFSSAHLHGSITNASSLTRFSLELRTLHLNDLLNNLGAPNVDNKSQQLLVGLYSAVENGRPLKEFWTPNHAA